MRRLKARSILVYDFRVAFRTQKEWSWLIALAFFLGELGAGLFLVGLWLDFLWGAIAGWLIVVVGKTGTHLIYLGRVERVWRMVMNPGTSWISRGLIGVAAFVVVGGTYCLTLAGGLPLGAGSTPFWLVKLLAAAVAFFVLIYDGFVMNSSPAIPLWNTALLPVLCVTYGLLAGTTVTLVMLSSSLAGSSVSLVELERAEIVLVSANLLIIAVYLMAMHNASLAARESVRILVARQLAPYFWGLALFVGLVVTLALVVLFALAPLPGALVGAAVSEIVGDYFIRFVVLRGGVYSLPMTHPNFATN